MKQPLHNSKGTAYTYTSEAIDGQQYAYAFDGIGNRITAAESDTDRTASYTANALNQYTQRTVPDEKDLIGTAPTNVAVTVNQNPVSRQSAYWHHALEVDNTTAAAYPQVAITAVYNPPGTNDPDVVTSQTGRVFVAETPESFTYDDDGNLTQDGRFDYTWDAENRLISATTRDGLPADLPRVRVTHHYDHQSRRIATARETWSGAAWEPTGTNRYVYDGWNLVAEVRAAAPANTNLYVWGLDLSGSLQGAGGIGGLLTVRKRLDDGTGIVRNYDYMFDANGNVVQETFRTDGTINAHYEYDPFGNTVVALRLDATDNPFRFSTKWFDNDTGLGYWGYRWYGPGMGRWLTRDPLGEGAGCNLLAFIRNSPVVDSDIIGLASSRNCRFTVGSRKTSLGTAADFSTGKLKSVGAAHIDIFGFIGDADLQMIRQGWGGGTDYEYNSDDYYHFDLSIREDDNTGTLRWGSGRETCCKDASCEQIKECLKAAPEPVGDPSTAIRMAFRNCQNDVEHAVAGCCLTGYVALNRNTDPADFGEEGALQECIANYWRAADRAAREASPAVKRMLMRAVNARNKADAQFNDDLRRLCADRVFRGSKGSFQ